ncbi:MAG: 3-methyl-2-oxobutanoate hydroxymethyltransferase [Enterobacteriaceae bacterium]
MKTISNLNYYKKNKIKIPALTVYDYSFAKLFEREGIKVMLIGDSLGMTIKGYKNTINVNVEDIIYHTKCVRKGANSAFLIADMPFMSYTNINSACKNAEKIIKSGANMVKLEVGFKWVNNIITELTEKFVPVCGHIGLLPQSANLIGKYSRKSSILKEDQILNYALEIEKSGAKLLVLECVKSSISKTVASKLKIPVIGVGSGIDIDGQILVMQDLIGITNNPPFFSKNFLIDNGSISKAVQSYIKEVKNKEFPSKKHIIF